MAASTRVLLSVRVALSTAELSLAADMTRARLPALPSQAAAGKPATPGSPLAALLCDGFRAPGAKLVQLRDATDPEMASARAWGEARMPCIQ